MLSALFCVYVVSIDQSLVTMILTAVFMSPCSVWCYHTSGVGVASLSGMVTPRLYKTTHASDDLLK